MMLRRILPIILVLQILGCASPNLYHDPNMDFGVVKTVAVMPFQNLSGDKEAGERVRDVFMNMLLSTGTIYFLPPGEVARGISRAGLADPFAPSVDEAKQLGTVLGVNAVITGVVREYGPVRSGTASSNVISVSLSMIEVQSGKVVWTASSTKGGISTTDRLFGGGGQPMNGITEEAASDLIRQLFH